MIENNRVSEQQRAELHKAIWNVADSLRGSVEGWDFKNYILGFMFYRFISEDITNYVNKNEAENGNPDFNYAAMSDEDALEARDIIIREKGYYIAPSNLFQNVRARAKDESDLNIKLRTIFREIEESSIGHSSEGDMKGLFDDIDLNSNKLGGSVARINTTLVKLFDGIGSMNFGDASDAAIDAMGDAYEYIIGMYASNAGKSGGEFFTPQQVSELLAKITSAGGNKINKVYDPACGSGSLLLKFKKVLNDTKDNPTVTKYCGQEINPTTYNLCRINMFLHNIGYEKFSIKHGDTLLDPQHMDEQPFDAIVSNPPYSIKWDSDSNPILINDPRFAPAGVLAPKSKADLAFVMHILHHLSEQGTAAIVEFPGVLYRGGAEQKIRKYLIDNNYVDTIIQLPENLFYGTSIATCILVLKKGSKKDGNVLFIDASKEFVKETNNNKLSEQNLENILNAYKDRKDIDYFCKLVSNEDIANESYTLSVSTYVEKEDTSEKIDIKELNAEIARVVKREEELRKEIDKIIADLED